MANNEAERRARAVRRYKRAADVEARAHRVLEAAFLPTIHNLLSQEQYSEARTLMLEMPDSVAKVFAMDALRQHRNKKLQSL